MVFEGNILIENRCLYITTFPLDPADDTEFESPMATQISLGVCLLINEASSSFMCRGRLLTATRITNRSVSANTKKPFVSSSKYPTIKLQVC